MIISILWLWYVQSMTRDYMLHSWPVYCTYYNGALQLDEYILVWRARLPNIVEGTYNYVHHALCARSNRIHHEDCFKNLKPQCPL